MQGNFVPFQPNFMSTAFVMTFFNKKWTFKNWNNFSKVFDITLVITHTLCSDLVTTEGCWTLPKIVPAGLLKAEGILAVRGAHRLSSVYISAT